MSNRPSAVSGQRVPGDRRSGPPLISRSFSLQTILIALAVVAALVAPWLSGSAYHIVLLNQALIFSLVVIGLNFIYGFGGIFSLAQAAFWGIGAYTSALLTVDAHMPFVVGMTGAVLVAALFGFLLGVPTLKLRSHYLTMATLAFAEAARLVLMNTDWLTHGAQGVRGIPPASLGPIAFDDPYRFYYLSLTFVLLAVLFTVRFRRSRLGRALQATRDDDLAAGCSGVDVTYLRVLAFVLSAMLAGVAGSLWAHFSAYISPETFDLFATIRFVSMLLIGGAGSAAGPVVGAVFLTYLPEWLRFLESYYMAIYGLSIVLILVFAPQGFVGLATRLGAVLRASGEAAAKTRRHEAAGSEVGNGAENGRGEGVSPFLGASVQGPPHSSPLLVTSGLTMAFGGLVAVRDVGLEVEAGEIHGIIGPNGSGKTTLLNMISGIYRPASGAIVLDGRRVDGARSAELVERGVARTFQNIRLFPQLTVLQNVEVASYCRTRAGLGSIFLGTGGASREERTVEEDALAMLEFVGLRDRSDDLPGDLPYGEQRLLEIARALATRPKLLLLDEPAAGMSLAEKQRLVHLIRIINRQVGATVIIIEHDMRVIGGLCHRVTVLNFGEIIAAGTASEVRNDDAVIEAYLGRSRRRVVAR